MTAEVEVWQGALATEHAVIWAYGLVGATDDLAGTAEAALTVHRAHRATCIDVLTGLGADPVPSAPAYDVGMPTGPAAGRDLAATLEQSASVAYASLAGSDDRDTRLLAARWLRESAIMQIRWDGQIPPLPGLTGD